MECRGRKWDLLIVRFILLLSSIVLLLVSRLTLLCCVEVCALGTRVLGSLSECALLPSKVHSSSQILLCNVSP